VWFSFVCGLAKVDMLSDGDYRVGALHVVPALHHVARYLISDTVDRHGG
jgi:hypothetical protein